MKGCEFGTRCLLFALSCKVLAGPNALLGLLISSEENADVNMVPGAVFTIFHVFHYLRMGPISYHVALHLAAMSPGPNALAYWAHSSILKKMKCCKFGSRCLMFNLCCKVLPGPNALAYWARS